MSDRVQALRKGIDERMQTAREEGLQSQAWKRQADIDEFIRFLASQELGWAEKLKVPKVYRKAVRQEDQIYNAIEKIVKQGILKAGAVKFVPLEIK